MTSVFLRAIFALALLSVPVAAQQLPQLRSGSTFCNPGAKQAPGTDCTLTQFLDRAAGSTGGTLIQRGASGWVANVMSGDATISNAGVVTLSAGAAATLNYWTKVGSDLRYSSGKVLVGSGALGTSAFEVRAGAANLYPLATNTSTSFDAAWSVTDGTNIAFMGLLPASGCGSGNWAVYHGGACRLTITGAGAAAVPGTLAIGGGSAITSSGGGGALGTNAFTSTAFAPLASPTFTGTVTIPTPFTIGAVSMTATGTQLNYLAAATGTTGTTSTNVVFSTSPTLVTPVLGAATGTSLALGGCTISTNALCMTGTANISGSLTQGTAAVHLWSSDTGLSRVSAGVIGVGTGSAGSVAGGLQAASLALGGCIIGSNALCTTGTITSSGQFQFSGAGGQVAFRAFAASVGTNFLTANIINTGGDTTWGLTDSTGTAGATGLSAYAGFIGTNNATSFNIVTNGASRVAVNSSGLLSFQAAGYANCAALGTASNVVGCASSGAATLLGNPTASTTSDTAFTIQGLNSWSANTPSTTLDYFLVYNHTTTRHEKATAADIAAAVSGGVTSITPGSGLTSTIIASAPGGAITTTGTLSAAQLIRATTGTPQTIADSDRGGLVTVSHTAAIGVTLPQATGTSFRSGWFTEVRNFGGASAAASGIATITPAAGSLLNGSTAAVQLLRGQSMRIISNGTDYDATFGRRFYAEVTCAEFGCMGDSSTNDQPAIQACVDYSVNNPFMECVLRSITGGSVYMMNAPLTLNSNAALRGSTHNSELRFTYDSDRLLQSYGGASIVEVSLRRFHINANGHTGVIGMLLLDSSSWFVENIAIDLGTGANNYGIVLDTSLSTCTCYNTFVRTQVLANAATAIAYRLASNANMNAFINPKATGDASNLAYAFQLATSAPISGTQIFGASIEKTTTGIYVGSQVAGLNISGARFEVVTTGIETVAGAQNVVATALQADGTVTNRITDTGNALANFPWEYRQIVTVTSPGTIGPQLGRDHFINTGVFATECHSTSKVTAAAPSIGTQFIVTAIPAAGGVYVRVSNITSGALDPGTQSNVVVTCASRT